MEFPSSNTLGSAKNSTQPMDLTAASFCCKKLNPWLGENDKRNDHSNTVPERNRASDDFKTFSFFI